MNSLDNKVIAFLPCRKGSERVLKKNIRSFGPYKNGLLEVKIGQLLGCRDIDHIVLSTNDIEILDFVKSIGSPRITLHKRSEDLASSSTSTDSLISHARNLISEGHILWTHVTSPFVGSETYSNIISSYRGAIDAGYDSLVTTTLLHAFLWSDDGPINYDRELEKWPRTQTLKPIHEINSAVFLSSTNNYDLYGDRIGVNPFLHQLDRLTALDIDWEEDFIVAEQLLNEKLVSI